MASTDISVIIATRNREEVLWLTLEKACAATAEAVNAEIIVVNDGDEILNIPGKFLSAVQFYKNPKRGVSCARNFGAEKAQGSILFFTDDDMWITAESLKWISENINTPGSNSVVYNINWHYPPALTQQLNETKIGRYQLRAAYNTMWGRMVTGQKQEPAAGLYPFNTVMSGSLVMSKTTFEKIGRYNEQMIFQGEDADLTQKIISNGVKIFCVFDVMLFHNQQDRFDIDNFLSRTREGYASEFRAAKNGFITNRVLKKYVFPGIIIFHFFYLTEFFWLWLLNALPNNAFCSQLNNRLIGVLSGLQHYKEWRKQKGNR